MPVSFQQNQKFRTQPEAVISEFNFVGGLRVDAHETKLESNESPAMANIVYNETGSIKTRNGYLPYAKPDTTTLPVGATSDTDNDGTSTGSLSLTVPEDMVAQSFELSGAANIVRVDAWMSMANSGEEQLVRVELWGDDSGPSTLLAQGPILRISGDTETKYPFVFRTPTAFSASTTYFIVIRPFVRGSTQSVREVEVHHTANDYADGSAWSSDDTGQTWVEDNTVDLKFEVYVDGDTPCTGLIRYYGPAGVQQTIAKYGDSLYLGDDITGDLTAMTLPNTLEPSSYIDHTITNDTLLVVDGFSKILKYRGSTLANYTTGTVAVTNASRTVTGTSTVWATNAEVNQYILLPDGKWYLITSVASDTSLEIETNYLGVTASGENYTISAWGAVEGALTSDLTPSNLVAPRPQFIANHLNRIWVMDGNHLYFSVLDTSVTGEHFNNFDTMNNAGQVILPTTVGDTGTGLYSLNGYLYIFQNNSIWELFGNSPANFELRNVSNEVGLVNRRTLIEYDKYLIFLAANGLYIFDGVNVKNLSVKRVNTLINSWANKTNPSAVLWEDKYLISYTPSGQTHNTDILVYDIPRDIFGRMKDVPAGVWSVWTGGTDQDQVYFGSSNQGSLYQWNVGGNDAGYEIETIYDMPSMGFAAGINDKTLKKFYVQQLAKGDYNMQITQISDIGAENIVASVNLDNGSTSLYDQSLYDQALYPMEGGIITTRIAEFQGLAKYFKFRFEQVGYDEGVEILAAVVTARKRRLL